MVKMTPEQEAEYALGFGVARSELPRAAQEAYDRLVEQRTSGGTRADACASGQIGLLRRLPLQHPAAAARRRTRMRLFVLFYDVRHVDYAGHNADSPPTQERGTDRRSPGHTRPAA